MSGAGVQRICTSCLAPHFAAEGLESSAGYWVATQSVRWKLASAKVGRAAASEETMNASEWRKCGGRREFCDDVVMAGRSVS